MSLIWSIGSSAIFAVLWYFVLAANTLDYQQLLPAEVERTVSQNSNSPRTIETNPEAENGWIIVYIRNFIRPKYLP